MPRPLALQALAALLLMLAACTPTSAPTALTDTVWTLEMLHDRPLIDGSTITLEFDERSDESLGGSSGCNSYGARYQATDMAFRVVGGVESTAMACVTPAGVMEQEQAYTEALMDVSTYRLTAGRLDMADEGGDTVLVFRAQE